jgi:hypothetical protein
MCERKKHPQKLTVYILATRKFSTFFSVLFSIKCHLLESSTSQYEQVYVFSSSKCEVCNYPENLSCFEIQKILITH